MSENKNAKTSTDDGQPVAWISERENLLSWDKFYDHMKPLYKSLPKREWVGLTAYEIQEIHSGNKHWGSFACAIEAKLKEKNQ